MEGNDSVSIDVNDGKFYDLGGTGVKENGEEGFLPEATENIENHQENNEFLDEQVEKIEQKEDEKTLVKEETNNLEVDSGENQEANFEINEVKVDEKDKENFDDLDSQQIEGKENDRVLGNIPFTDSNIEKIEKEEVDANFFEEPGNFEQIFFKSEVNEDESLKITQEKMWNLYRDIEGLLQEMNTLKVRNQSLEFECAEKDEAIKKLKRIINK